MSDIRLGLMHAVAEIEQLRIKLAAAEAERDELRAELAAERERRSDNFEVVYYKERYRHLELTVDASQQEREGLRAELAAEREAKQCAVDAAEAYRDERDELRELLREAQEALNFGGFISDKARARIDAALEGDRND